LSKIKNTGIVRKIDELGRIALPIETRKQLGFEIKDGLEILVDVESHSIILKPVEHKCVFCCSDDNLSKFAGHSICRDCVVSIQGI